MRLIVDFLKSTQPASLTGIISAFTVGVVLLYAKPRWGRLWLTVVTAGYWLLATPVGALVLAWPLTTDHAPLQSASSAGGATTVVMLGGGSRNIQAGNSQLSLVNTPSALRAIETARLYHLLGDPLVIVSGGVTDKRRGAAPETVAYEAAMEALGVPVHRVVGEAESRNTHDEAVILARMLRERQIDRFVLVTSPLHMRRSLAVFAAQGLHPVPSPAPLRPDRLATPFPLLPNDGALELGNDAVYEWLASAYYWAEGWTRSNAANR
jgi:uncharacterized SAM-binding protein YcdF (DUF218 family)